MAHKGVREFTGEELSGVALGQNGFHILSNGAYTAASKGCTYWIAIKAIHVDATVQARSVTNGDDLSQNGAYSGSAVEVLNGDIVYGVFDKVKVNGSDYILAYRGK